MKTNNKQSKAKPLKKRVNLRFKYDNDGVLYTIEINILQCKKGWNVGWKVICRPPDLYKSVSEYYIKAWYIRQ